uniref:Uncharacterized protein n=1 Tax=Chromera velia CCMP2878 TaxID=1169474 RepID=A0A0G4F636_9ALVE|eukprot:Cvel_15213.t1-p1 / transcript=Cvel_15213.t1 / gene=Cvel_15213 / organism=Chromera_velia_CCMP2878 / gene_product=hypothetical protein / transcript_product=hypothetical protein / location=Cvel_scaffold1113:3533-9459(-) / protein_length=1144 / sequence_SO=supercontig / SO=protein_coding / is_pseudo=false
MDIPLFRTDYGIEQRWSFRHADRCHEELDEVDFSGALAEPLSGSDEVQMFSFLLTGDQNAGKSTLLHAFCDQRNETFTQLCSFLPILSSSFVNCRLLRTRPSSHRAAKALEEEMEETEKDAALESLLVEARDELPFLDTDVARGLVTLSADDFRFFCLEFGIQEGEEGDRPVGADEELDVPMEPVHMAGVSGEGGLVSDSARFVCLHFCEIGGDHLDRLMEFSQGRLLTGDNQTEERPSAGMAGNENSERKQMGGEGGGDWWTDHLSNVLRSSMRLLSHACKVVYFVNCSTFFSYCSKSSAWTLNGDALFLLISRLEFISRQMSGRAAGGHPSGLGRRENGGEGEVSAESESTKVFVYCSRLPASNWRVEAGGSEVDREKGCGEDAVMQPPCSSGTSGSSSPLRKMQEGTQEGGRGEEGFDWHGSFEILCSQIDDAVKEGERDAQGEKSSSPGSSTSFSVRDLISSVEKLRELAEDESGGSCLKEKNGEGDTMVQVSASCADDVRMDPFEEDVGASGEEGRGEREELKKLEESAPFRFLKAVSVLLLTSPLRETLGLSGLLLGGVHVSSTLRGCSSSEGTRQGREGPRGETVAGSVPLSVPSVVTTLARLLKSRGFENQGGAEAEEAGGVSGVTGERGAALLRHVLAAATRARESGQEGVWFDRSTLGDHLEEVDEEAECGRHFVGTVGGTDGGGVSFSEGGLVAADVPSISLVSSFPRLMAALEKIHVVTRVVASTGGPRHAPGSGGGPARVNPLDFVAPQPLVLRLPPGNRLLIIAPCKPQKQASEMKEEEDETFWQGGGVQGAEPDVDGDPLWVFPLSAPLFSLTCGALRRSCVSGGIPNDFWDSREGWMREALGFSLSGPGVGGSVEREEASVVSCVLNSLGEALSGLCVTLRGESKAAGGGSSRLEEGRVIPGRRAEGVTAVLQSACECFWSARDVVTTVLLLQDKEGRVDRGRLSVWSSEGVEARAVEEREKELGRGGNGDGHPRASATSRTVWACPLSLRSGGDCCVSAESVDVADEGKTTERWETLVASMGSLFEAFQRSGDSELQVDALNKGDRDVLRDGEFLHDLKELLFELGLYIKALQVPGDCQQTVHAGGPLNPNCLPPQVLQEIRKPLMPLRTSEPNLLVCDISGKGPFL